MCLWFIARTVLGRSESLIYIYILYIRIYIFFFPSRKKCAIFFSKSKNFFGLPYLDTLWKTTHTRSVSFANNTHWPFINLLSHRVQGGLLGGKFEAWFSPLVMLGYFWPSKFPHGLGRLSRAHVKYHSTQLWLLMTILHTFALGPTCIYQASASTLWNHFSILLHFLGLCENLMNWKHSGNKNHALWNVSLLLNFNILLINPHFELPSTNRMTFNIFILICCEGLL